MPDSVWRIPGFLSGMSLVCTFIVATALFHWLFVYPWLLSRFGRKPLTKRGWKIVDYIWLGVGSVALVGTASQARQLLANTMLPQMESIVGQAPDSAIYYASPQSYDGLLCRTFARSPLSPPPEVFDAIVAQYDKSCAWAHEMNQHVASIGRWDYIDVSKLPARPPATEEQITRYEQEMFDRIREHNLLVERRRALQASKNRSEYEETLSVLSPLFAVLALALRVTKVTGEIRLG